MALLFKQKLSSIVYTSLAAFLKFTFKASSAKMTPLEPNFTAYTYKGTQHSNFYTKLRERKKENTKQGVEMMDKTWHLIE